MGYDHIHIFKLPMGLIIERGNRIENYTMEQAIMDGNLVSISNSQLTGKITDFFEENGLLDLDISDAIVNIVVPSASGRNANKVAEEYNKLAHTGFDINRRHYVRLCAGSGQLRNNTITFVWDAMYGYLTETLYCGISPEQLGESFSVSKWNAYFGLSESGMRFLKSYPHVCVISDYEMIKPHLLIDYIETESSGGRKSRKVDKSITRHYYDDSDMDFAPLNSFDGQGLADPEWMREVALELGYLSEDHGYVPSEFIIRAPWCKGLVASFDFKAYCREYGVTTICDVYGQEHDVSDIDILLSTSQFKMWKVYQNCGGWAYHQACMRKYNLHWGVVIANKERDDDYRALNYQYLQALDLDDSDIDKLCELTKKRLINLCSGDIETVYKSLVGFSAADGDSMEGKEDKLSTSLLQKAVTHNYELLGDTHIQELIYREVEAKFNGAKIGKLLCRGGYSFILSDPVAQIQHIIKHHAVGNTHDIEVAGLIPAHTIYSAYWNRVQPAPENIVLMRSPLIDQSEVTVCGLVRTPEMDRWYAHIQSGLIFSILDVNTLALQNCDFDGDRCFSSNDPVLIKGAKKEPVPILYPSAGAQLKGAITPESMIDADVRGLNSAVGGLSNQATCLYALRDKFQKGSSEYVELTRRIKIISELVGVEIDKIKTGIPPRKPSAWNKERLTYEQFNSGSGDGKTVRIPACSAEEQERIRHHNSLIPENKPVFMRYIYDAMDNDLVKYDKAFDNVCKFNDGIRLTDLLAAEYNSLNETDKQTVDRYRRYRPAIDSPCIMNKICQRFEDLQKRLRRHKGSRNMLPDFATQQQLDDSILEEMAFIMDLFQRQKRFIIRSNNANPDRNSKYIANEARDRFDILHSHIRKQIMELVEGDAQSAYNYLSALVECKQCTEASVWAVLDELILFVIPNKPYREGVAA